MAGFKIDLRGHEVLEMTIANAHAKAVAQSVQVVKNNTCLLYTSPSPRD